MANNRKQSRKKNPASLVAGKPILRAFQLFRTKKDEAQYVIAEPRYDPSVPASTTPAKLSFPWAARNAAGGMTISLGTGKIELSIAINTTIPM